MAAQARRIVELASLGLGLSLSASPAFAGVARPDPLASQANCDSYQGTSAPGANDPTQLFELRVCPSTTGVSARLQSSSLVSGFSVRASEGSWDPSGQTLTLAETSFIVSRPEPGWRFCLIDALVLTKTETGLEGTYVSVACDDRASLKLDAILPASAPALAPPEPVSPEPRPPEPRPPSESPSTLVGLDEPSTCACRSLDDRRPSPMLALLAIAGLAGIRRRAR